MIEDAKFKTFGCGSAIASSSLATEWLKGKTVDEAAKIKNTDIVKELNLPPVKIHCSVLAEDAIKAAVADYKRKQGDVEEAEKLVAGRGHREFGRAVVGSPAETDKSLSLSELPTSSPGCQLERSDHYRNHNGARRRQEAAHRVK